jgi:hypothetical protein
MPCSDARCESRIENATRRLYVRANGNILPRFRLAVRGVIASTFISLKDGHISATDLLQLCNTSTLRIIAVFSGLKCGFGMNMMCCRLFWKEKLEIR